MILAAGFGKRLQPLTLTVPKPLVPVNNQPILDHVLDHLRQGGIKRCMVNTHYLADQIHHHLQGITLPQISLSHEPAILDTGGAIQNVLSFFQEEPFFTVNADIWWEQKSIFDRLKTHWDPQIMDALLVVVPHKQTIGFKGPGDFFMQESGKLHHRGTGSNAPFINAGIQLFHPRAFKDMPYETFPLLELYQHLEAQGRLYGLILSGMWCDMGTCETLNELEEYLQL